MIYVFGDCELDADLHELKVGETTRTVEPQVFDLLLYLVENRDRMVTKDELFEAASKFSGLRKLKLTPWFNK